VLECEFVPLRSRPIHRLHAADSAGLAAALEWAAAAEAEAAGLDLPGPIRRPIVEVEYFTDIPDAYARIMTLADRCFVFPRPRDRERSRRRAAAGRTQPALTLEAAVARLAAPGTPGHDWTLRLLDAKDKRAEWLAIVAELEGAVR
jgi:hypothetical protein